MLLVGFAACTPVSLSEVDRGSTTSSPAEFGDLFPDLLLEDREGRSISPRDWQGAVAVVAFVSFGPGASADESRLALERLVEIPDRLPTIPLRLFALRMTPAAGEAGGAVQILSAPFERMVALAAAFGITVSIDGDRYHHGHATVVVDRTGRVRAVLRGVTSWDAAGLALEVAAAATR